VAAWCCSRRERTQGWLILEAGSVSYGKATSYLPVIDLLKTYFGIDARDDARRIREKLTGKLLTLDEALQPTLPAFLGLLDVPVENAAWQALDPLQLRQRTLDAIKRLLLRESQVQPLCLVFEDLHWIDSERQALLDSLVESLPAARVLLLVNYRPEYQQGWGRKTYYSQLRIDPLPPESVEELLRALLGDGEPLQPLKRLLIERTEGNPFFLEESVRTLVETHALVGERGAYSPARELSTVQVPATVQAILAARIDRLPLEAKTLLQTAAVIGKDVPHPLLRGVAGLGDEQLQSGLAHLQAGEFLYEASLFPDLEYTFKHALTHEVAYGSLLQDRRRALHARIVEALEQLYPDRLAEQIERLAHHRGVAIARTRNVVFLAPVVGAWLGLGLALAGRAQEGISLLEEAGRDARARGQLGRVLTEQLMLAEAHVLNGRLGEAAAVALDALDTARRTRRRGVEAWVLRALGDIAAAGAAPDLGEAERRYRAALDLARQLGMRPLVAHCHRGLGRIDRLAGRLEQAREHLTTAMTMYREMDMRFYLEQAEAELRDSATP
jgi:predicted ATPase